MTTNDATVVVVDDPNWAQVRDALQGVSDAMAVIGQVARESLFPRALRVSELLIEQRGRYPTALEFHAACEEQLGLGRSAVEDYLRLARKRELIEAEITNGTQIRSLRGALALLRSPRPEPAALPVGDPEPVDTVATMPVVLTDDPAAAVGSLLTPLSQAMDALGHLMAHPQLQGRPDLLQRVLQVEGVLGALSRTLAAALRSPTPAVTAEQEDLPLMAAEVVVEAKPDATDRLLADALGLEPAVVAMPPAGRRSPLADRYPQGGGAAAESLRRLEWDIDRSGGQQYLGAKLGVSKQAVSSYRKALQRAVAEQSQDAA